MKVSTFLQSKDLTKTTLSEMKRVHDWARTDDFIGAFAYATMSGAAAFDLQMGSDFWDNTKAQFLFGIDYGRTQPSALRHVAKKKNAELRVHDGLWVLDQPGFVPRIDFHAKASAFSNSKKSRYGMVIGSGNFSSNGLRKSVEAAAVLQAKTDQEYDTTIRHALNAIQSVWEDATPLEDIIDDYEERWTDAAGRTIEVDRGEGEIEVGEAEIFWIEAGYVTLNRGPSKPGNQIDFPRGMSHYFGFSPPKDLDKNSVIGEVTFLPPFGDEVTRNLRLGNNLMEKISLPIPETHGFDIYDGKVLVFQRSSDKFIMRALEPEDFEKAFGDHLAEVREMGSGRRYGHIG